MNTEVIRRVVLRPIYNIWEGMLLKEMKRCYKDVPVQDWRMYKNGINWKEVF